MGNLAAHGKAAKVCAISIKVVNHPKEVMCKIFKIKRSFIVVAVAVATGVPGYAVKCL